jgi:cysteinyl-tRNA synthetase
MLSIYNTLTKSKDVFKPLVANQVRMYVCGMTVYDFCHIGHARVMVAFDVVTRWLRHRGYEVTYVRNITDIDDKIIKRANENGEPFEALVERMIKAMHEDEARLNVLRPDQEPRATGHIAGMHQMIQTLIDKGFAYAPGNGDVYYRVGKFVGYGKLSRKKIEDLKIGARIEVDEAKQDPLDFVLWKHAKPAEPADAKWASPWGDGRPGWHIECSAMSSQLLGDHFDIHGGGADLQFPHHENEIAQSEGAHGHTFVNYWMHNGFVRVDDEKMSKSLGNFFTIREVLKQYDPEVVRFFILRAHYRSPLNYSDAHLDDARGALSRLYTTLKNVPPADARPDWTTPAGQRLRNAMDDDFNTPEAMAVLFELSNDANRSGDPAVSGELRALAGVLGLLERSAEEFLQGRAQAGGLDDAQIDALIEQRIAAKKARDFATADRVRDELKQQGVILEDSAAGTTWRRA